VKKTKSVILLNRRHRYNPLLTSLTCPKLIGSLNRSWAWFSTFFRKLCPINYVRLCYTPQIMNTSQQAVSFFELWVDACIQRYEVLHRDWSNCSAFTSHVFSQNSIIEAIGKALGFRCYCGYYSIDAILFTEDDLVPGRPAGTTWVRRIRIAFEHENDFDSGLFQEVSHLLITDCDLRVVVSYPGNREELDSQLEYLHSIIAGTDRSDRIAEDRAFLFIAGWRDIEKHTIEWWGYVYDHTAWRRLPSPTAQPNTVLAPTPTAP